MTYSGKIVTELDRLVRRYDAHDLITKVTFDTMTTGQHERALAFVESVGGRQSALTINMARKPSDSDIGTWWHAPKGTDPAELVMRHEFGHILDNATGAAAREIKAVEAIIRKHIPESTIMTVFDLVEKRRTPV